LTQTFQVLISDVAIIAPERLDKLITAPFQEIPDLAAQRQPIVLNAHHSE
jgi:hypothetical protein